MKLQIMALYDVKIGAFMTPFFSQSINAAMRSLGDLVNSGGEEAPARHPEDFSLHCLGSWNALDGSWFVDQPQRVCEAAALKIERK